MGNVPFIMSGDDIAHFTQIRRSSELTGQRRTTTESNRRLDGNDGRIPWHGTNAWDYTVAKYFGSISTECYDKRIPYGDICSNWLDNVAILQDKIDISRYSLDGSTTQYRLRRNISFPTITNPKGGSGVGSEFNVIGATMREAINKLGFKIMKMSKELAVNAAPRVMVQMDSGEQSTNESLQGVADQAAVTAVNTTITRDTTEELATGECMSGGVDVASTEKPMRFKDLTGRWMPLSNFSVTTTQARGTTIFSYTLPKDIMTTSKCAPNIAPLEAFAYGQFDFDIKVVMNANKFQAGKMIVAARFDPYQAPSSSTCIQGMLSRPHVILDFPTRNEGTVHIPWKFHAPFVRMVATSTTAQAAQSGTAIIVECMVLSPLNVTTDAATTAYGQVFYKMTKADLTGMSYRVSFQGDLDDYISTVMPLRTITAVAEGVATASRQLGSSRNQDKPNVPMTVTVVPKPRSMFPNFKGNTDATALRGHAMGLTNFHEVRSPTDEPKSPLELARIFGLRSSSTWKTSDTVGTRLFDVPIDPTSRNARYYGALTPLEYACAFHAFWMGIIDLRFDFVSTAFHQGTVMISIEYNRPVTNSTDLCSTASTYTKTFHLGNQKSVSMKVPFIFDTMFRRTNGAFHRLLASDGDYPQDNTDQKYGMNLAMDVHARVRMTVVNELVPVQSVSQQIEVLMFWRAGENFKLMGVKQCDFSDSLTNSSTNYIHQLPIDLSSYASPPVGAVRVQMDVDTGSKEDLDSTPSFSPGRIVKDVQISDESADFKDILRRPTMIMFKQTANEVGSFSNNTVCTGFFIPVMPPNRNMTNLNHESTNDTWALGSIGTSPSTAIINLFRGWKGSSVYNLMFAPSTGVSAIYVTYLPHSGTCMVGNHLYPTAVATSNRAFVFPFMNAYATEIVIPGINPTTSIVAPYETELNWTLCWDDNGASNYTWRDKGYLNAGHIVISPVGGSTEVTAWWSAGDDFDLAMFYGPSYIINESTSWRWTENNSATSDTSLVSTEYATWLAAAGSAVSLPTAASSGTTTTTSTTTTTTARSIPQAVQQDQSVAENAQQISRLSTLFGTGSAKYKDYHIPNLALDETAFWSQLSAKNKGKDLTKTNEIFSAYRKEVQRSNVHKFRHAHGPREQAKAQVQMERMSEMVSGITRTFPNFSGKIVRNTAVASIPIVGIPAVTAMTATELSDQVVHTAHKWNDVADSVKRLSDNLDVKLEELSTHAGTTIDQVARLLSQTVSGVTSLMSGVANATSIVYNLLLDVFIAWYHKSWMAVGVAIVRVIGTVIGDFAINGILALGHRLGQAIQDWVTVASRPTVQAESHVSEVLLAIIAGIAGTVIGVSIDSREVSWARKFVTRVTQTAGVAYFVQMLQFVKGTFQAIKEIIMWAIGRVSPEAAALKAFSGMSAEIGEFVTDAHTLMTEANRSMLSIPAYRTKAWKTVLQAHQLQRLLIEVPRNVASPVLTKLCSDVMKFGNENFLDMASNPVRFEPYVVCIEGETEIGKSFMTEELVTLLLEHIGYAVPTGNIAYYRQPGNQYWTGLRDQPVVVYDDWLQMNDNATVACQLSELFQLKTPALFCPNMAHLEEKKIRANPLIVVLLCNNGFPNVKLANCPEAVYRRRDIVIKASMRNAYRDMKVRDIPDDVRRAFGHLKFNFYRDASDAHSFEPRPYTFDQFRTILQNDFQSYHARELTNVRARMDRLFRLNRTVPIELINIRDPFKLYYSAQVGMPQQDIIDSWVPSERLERDVRDVYQHLMTAARAQPPGAVAADDHVHPQFELRPYIMGPTVFKYIFWGLSETMAWLGRKFIDCPWGRSVEPGQVRIMASCCVCGELRAIHRLCGIEAAHYRIHRNIRHATCEECWANVRRNPNRHCPSCRDPSEPTMIVHEAEIAFVVKLITAVGQGLMTMADAIRELMPIIGILSAVERMFDLVNYVTFLVLCSNGEEVNPYYLSSENIGAIVFRASLSVISLATGVGPQADNGDDVVTPPPPPPPAEIPTAADVPVPGPSTSSGLPSATLPAVMAGLAAIDRSASHQPPIETMEFRRSRRREIDHDEHYEHLPDPDDFGDEDFTGEMDIRFVSASAPTTPVPPTALPTGLVRIQVHNLDDRGVRVMLAPPAPVCYHVQLISDVASVRYSNGKWGLSYMGVMVDVVDQPCSTTCHWAGDIGRVHQEHFYEQYLTHRNYDLTTTAITWTTADRVSQKEFYAGKIPKALQPPWMIVPPPTADIQNLTSVTWWQWLTGIWEKYGWLLKIFAGIIAACTTLYAGYETYHYIFGTPAITEAVTVTEEVASGAGSLASMVQVQSPPGPRGNTTRNEIVRGNPPPRLVPQSAQAQAYTEIDGVVENYILRNSVSIDIYRDGQKRQVHHGIGICGYNVIMPKHYMEYILDKNNEVRVGPLNNPLRRQVITPDPKDFREFVRNDLVVWRWPRSTEPFKDIRRFFLKEADLVNPIPSECTLYLLPGKHLETIHAIDVRVEGARASVPVFTLEGEEFDIYDVLVYNYSRPGACGSLLKREGSQRPLLGVHVAGVGEGFTGHGYAVMLTQEMMSNLTLDVPEPPEVELKPVAQAEVWFPLETQVNYCGTLSKEETPFIPMSTRLVKSVVYDVKGLQTDHRPVFFRKSDPLYPHELTPLVYGCMKYGKLTRDFTTTQLESAKDFLTNLLRPIKPGVVNASRLTISQAVCGLKGIDYYDPMDLRTSAGYPLLMACKNKAHYLDVETDSDGQPIRATMKPELQKLYDDAYAVRSTGRRTPTYWVEVMKDEKLPLPKVMKQGGTRLICNGPMEYSIAMRQSFLHFSAAFMRDRKKLYHAVGINPVSMEWHMLACRLLNKSKNIIALDYSNFGPGLNARVCSMVCDVIREWTLDNVSGVSDLEMRSLMAEIYNSYHVAKNLVFTQNSGSPSGNVLTTVINSLVNIAYVYIAFESLTAEARTKDKFHAAEEFRNHVALFVYGDDMVMSVRTYEKEVNIHTLVNYFSQYGITATDAEKTGNLRMLPITEVEFLKRKFVMHPYRHKWMSQLRMDSILASTQWVWKSSDRGAMTRQNCMIALENTHGHGPLVMTQLSKIINEALVKARVDPITVSWNDVDNLFYNDGAFSTNLDFDD